MLPALLFLTSVVAGQLHRATAQIYGPCGQWNENGVSKAIVNGSNALAGRWPWMASIRINGIHKCGGALIGNRWVVSSAFCFIDQNTGGQVRSVEVILGADLSRGQGVSYQARTAIHPGYINNGVPVMHYDIAMVRLESPAAFSQTVSPICLPDSTDSYITNEVLYTAGWGYQTTVTGIIEYLRTLKGAGATLNDLNQLMYDLDRGTVVPPPYSPAAVFNNRHLQELQLRTQNVTVCYNDIVDYDKFARTACINALVDPLWCQSKGYMGQSKGMGTNFGYTNPYQMICAQASQQDRVKRAMCFGDSGGPMMKRRSSGFWALVGVVSFGANDCIIPYQPFQQSAGFFTNVYSHRQWIEDVIVLDVAAVSGSQPASPAGFLVLLALQLGSVLLL